MDRRLNLDFRLPNKEIKIPMKGCVLTFLHAKNTISPDARMRESFWHLIDILISLKNST